MPDLYLLHRSTLFDQTLYSISSSVHSYIFNVLLLPLFPTKWFCYNMFFQINLNLNPSNFPTLTILQIYIPYHFFHLSPEFQVITHTTLQMTAPALQFPKNKSLTNSNHYTRACNEKDRISAL